VKRGLKGIGRLSCANLGPILLLISKLSDEEFVTSLIDWRLFENPYLNLADIFFPTVEVSDLGHAFERLPSMIEELVQNIEPLESSVTNDASPEKRKNAERIARAWSDFDKLPERAGGVTSKAIVQSIRELNFSLDQLAGWAIAQNSSDSGTALIVSGINYDLRAQLLDGQLKPTEERTRKNFRETLASFVDPYIDSTARNIPDFFENFRYHVRVWRDDNSKEIIGKDIGVSRHQVSKMEHCIKGEVDEEGVFRGRVKACGSWLPDEGKILAASNSCH